jgi:lysophospholipase L1-like esterase
LRRWLTLSILLFCGALTAQQHVVTEKVEWTWADRPAAADAKLPNVLLIGDSITRGYYPETVKKLAGVANVYLFATSASSGDPRLPAQLHDYFAMAGIRFAVVHFNNGMHGWGYTEKEYAAGLPGMIAAVRAGAPSAKLIWATTTPVLHDSAESTNSRIDVRNADASILMVREKITLDDQHALMLKHPELHDGDVHFTAAGSARQAEQVVATIQPLL